MDADANLVLFEKDADTLAPPASMSKLMTLAIVFRELKAGRLKLEDQFKVSEHAWRTGGAPSGGSAMFAPLNTMVSVDDLIQGITVQSGNDAAIILAEGIAGSEEAFAKQMTEYAPNHRTREIDLRQRDRSAGRRPSDDARASSRSSPIISSTLTPSTITSSGRRSSSTATSSCSLIAIRSSLWILGVDGLKTGFIKESGYGLVASAKRGGQRLLLVVERPRVRRRTARPRRASCSTGVSRASSPSGCSTKARR